MVGGRSETLGEEGTEQHKHEVFLIQNTNVSQVCWEKGKTLPGCCCTSRDSRFWLPQPRSKEYIIPCTQLHWRPALFPRKACSLTPPKGILSESRLLPVVTTSPSWLLQSCLRSITAARMSANAPSLSLSRSSSSSSSSTHRLLFSLCVLFSSSLRKTRSKSFYL